MLTLKSKSTNFFISILIVFIFLVYLYLFFTFFLNFYNKKEGFVNILDKNNKKNKMVGADSDDEEEDYN